jgi:hypothetical protein
MRDEHYDPFRRLPHQGPPLEALVFVLARLRGDLTDSMRGSLRPGPHGCEAVYTLNGELYRIGCTAGGVSGKPAGSGCSRRVAARSATQCRVLPTRRR